MNQGASGFSIPFRIDANNGGVARQADYAEKLKENLIHIIMTGIGERVMQRKYGGGIKQLLHDPNNDALRSVVQHQISKAVLKYEPRIVLQGVNVNQLDGTLTAEVIYLIKQTQVPQNLIVPIGLSGL